MIYTVSRQKLASNKAEGKEGILNYFSEERKFQRAAESHLADLSKELGGSTRELGVVEKRLAESEKALRDFGLEWYAKGLDIQGEHAAAAEIRKELIETTEDKFAQLAADEAKKAGKKPPGGGGDPGASGGGGGAEGGGGASPPPDTPPAPHATESAPAGAASAELEEGLSAGSKFKGALGIAGAAIGGFVTGFFVGKDLAEGKIGEAALDATGVVPVLGEIVGYVRLIPLKVEQEQKEDELRRKEGYPPARRPWNY